MWGHHLETIQPVKVDGLEEPMATNIARAINQIAEALREVMIA